MQKETEAVLPAWMGKTVNGRLSQKENYDKADIVLSRRIVENATKRKASRRPIDEIHVSLSDPESALSRDKENVYCPLYSGQILTDAKSSLILGMSLSSHVTDVGTIGPMIDQVETTLGIKLNEIHADAAYSSLLDVKICLERNVNLFAPVQENSRSKANQSSKANKQLSRDHFQYNAETHSYTCPAGHSMAYHDRDNRQRVNGIIVMERFRQSTEKCQACPLAAQCLRGAKQRSVVRAIGQELIDAQKAKMTDAVALASRVLRVQTIERTNANIKQRIGLRRFGVTTLQRAKNCLALTIFVLNLMTVRRLLVQTLKTNARNNVKAGRSLRWCGEGARQRASLPDFVLLLLLVLSIAVLDIVLDQSLRCRLGTLDQSSQHRHDSFQIGFAEPSHFGIDRLKRQKYIVNRSAFQS